MDNNLIKFQGKSREGSENVTLRLHILSFQNLHKRYKNQLIELNFQLYFLKSNGDNHDSLEYEIQLLNRNLEIIEEQIKRLNRLAY